MADMRRFFLSVQQFLAMVVAVAVVLFAIRNNQPATVNLLFTEVAVPLSLLVLVPLLVGLLLGWLEGRLRRRRKEKARPAPAAPEVWATPEEELEAEVEEVEAGTGE
jgi:uncharacterized integral membrane protein